MPETATFDHYEVLTREDGSLFELGRGAMGITYKAFDKSLRFPVCLKVINSTYLNSEIARQRFVREARSAARLRHRHVASVFHLGTEGDTWFYAMEFIDGETLDALIKRQGPLSPAAALTITAQVARALNAASGHGLVHRDIKPANLMLVKEDDELVAKVIDFGLAKTSLGTEEDAATLSMGGFVGTPHFASPEQLEEKEIDSRSDIYSLGVTLWYMLAGQAPFAGSLAQVMSQHLSKPPPFEKFENLPPLVAKLLRKMLEKDPDARFQTPNDLRKEIESTLEILDDAPATSTGPIDAEDNFATLVQDSHSGETQFLTGAVIAGHYRISESLGETNAGRVFRAYDSERQRDVRMLVLPHEATGDAGICTSLEREVEKLAPVRHPNLLGVLDFETVDGGSFLVLEWTDGFSLLELLRARRELEAGEALALLKQAAAGVDHALNLSLTSLEFGLHQIQLHFPQAFEKPQLLRTRLTQWPAFELKLYPLGVTRELAASQTWAGSQTMVGGPGSSGAPRDGDARPRYVQALAAVIYEVLGGQLSPLVLAGAGGPTMRYTPLSTLSEEGNEVLKRALDPTRSYHTATEFSEALSHLEGLEVRPSGARPPTMPPPTPAARQTPIPPPPIRPATPPPLDAETGRSESKKGLMVLAGSAAVLLAISTTAFFVLRQPHGGKTDDPTPRVKFDDDGPEVTPKGDFTPPLADNPPPATPIPSTPPPVATPPPPPTRQDMLRAAVDEAQALEEKGEWKKSLSSWLEVAKEYPESPVSKNHLETLLDRLRQRPSPITLDEFKEMRDMITDAAQLDVLAGMMLLADNVREYEPVTAFNWYSAATAKGYAPAMTQLGLMLSNGAGTSAPDLVRAVQCFQAAADKGDAAGKAALGECYFRGKGVPENKSEAIKYFREAVDAGDVRAMNRLGDCYVKGTGVGVDFVEAVRLFTKASERGNLEATGNLGVLYITGKGVKADPEKAAALFKKGATGGNGFCARLYAQCLEDGTGIEPNQLQAQNMYRKAADAGDPVALDWFKKKKLPYP